MSHRPSTDTLNDYTISFKEGSKILVIVSLKTYYLNIS